MSSTLAFSTTTPSTPVAPARPGNDRNTAARMMAAARRQREAAVAAERREAKIARTAAGRLGHTTAVESDDDMGRFWMRFDATPEGARAAAEEIVFLSERGWLSDIDCTTQCPCVKVRHPEWFAADGTLLP